MQSAQDVAIDDERFGLIKRERKYAVGYLLANTVQFCQGIAGFGIWGFTKNGEL